jgi:hypothetical protein
MDRERYQKSEDILVDCLTSSLIGNWNMDQKSKIEHEQRGIFGYSQNCHTRIGNRRIQSSFEEMKTLFLGHYDFSVVSNHPKIVDYQCEMYFLQGSIR